MRMSDEEFMDHVAVSVLNGLLAGRHGTVNNETISQYATQAFVAAIKMCGARRATIELLDRKEQYGEPGNA